MKVLSDVLHQAGILKQASEPYSSGGYTVVVRNTTTGRLQNIGSSSVGAVSSVFGRTGVVVAQSGDYNTDQVTEGTNLYFTYSRARSAVSLTTTGSSGASSYNSSTGVFNVPNYTLSGLGGVPSSRTLTINGTGYDLSADRSWSVGTITALTGEATASGTGSVSITLDNASVIGKVLTGLNLTGGGTISATDTILQAFGKVQNQISALVGSVQYEGVWNASTNSPTILDGVGNKGDYYVVNVAGTVNIGGIADWKVGDWIIFNGTSWDKVDNTDAVSSVNGFTGAVSLSTSNISEGTNLYFTNTRARNAITLTTTGTSGAATYSAGTLNIPVYSISGLGGVPDTRTLTINGTAYDLTDNRSWSVGTVTSVGLTSSTTGVTIGSSPVTSSGSITIDIATASSSANGLLSSTDWSTFNSKQAALNGTGFVKISGTTISYDNSTYLTTSSASSTYVPYTGASGDVNLGANQLTAKNLLIVGDNSSQGGILALKQFDATTQSLTGHTVISALSQNTLYFNFSQAGGNTRTIGFSSGSIANGAIRTFTFPNASGTIALTSDLSGYLPLTGGTLTGALSGTSATFSSLVTINRSTTGLVLNRPAVTNYNGIGYQTNGVQRWFVGLRENLSSDNYIIYNEGLGTDVLTLSNSTGAATFSSSVTAGGFVMSKGQLPALVASSTFFDYISTNIGRFAAVSNATNTYPSIVLSQYSSDGSLGRDAVTIASTGAATFSSSVSGTQFNATSKYAWGTATDGTTGQIATDNTNNYFDYKGNLYFRGAAASNTLVTFTSAGAATFSSSVTVGTDIQYSSNAGYGILSQNSTRVLAFTNSSVVANVNVGIGVTPSAWNASYKAIQISNSALWSATNDLHITSNTLYDSAYKYIENGYATRYNQYLGQHIWYNAPNNTSGAGAALTFTQAMTLDSSGRLGIGTSSPANKLDVNGNIGITSGNSAYFYRSANDYYWRIHSDTSNFLRFGTYLSNGTDYGTNPKVILQDDGKVGIGTAAPAYILDVYSSVGTARLLNTTAPPTGGVVTLLLEGTNNYSGVNQAYIKSIFPGVSGQTNLTFGTSSTLDATATERMRITWDGKVGIGTTSPSYRTHIVAPSVAGSSTALAIENPNTSFTSSEVRMEFLQGGGNWQYISAAFNSGAPYLSFGTGYTGGVSERMRITSAGSLLIGQTTNTQGFRLMLAGSAGSADDLGFNSNASYSEIQSFNSKPLILNRQGNNVGIGRNPLSKLAVYGGPVQIMQDYPGHQLIVRTAGIQGTYNGQLTITIPEMTGAGSSQGYGGYSCEVYVAGYSGMYCHAWFSGYINNGLTASEATILRSNGGWSISQASTGTYNQGFIFVLNYPDGLIHPTARIIFNKGGDPNVAEYDANSITAVWS